MRESSVVIFDKHLFESWLPNCGAGTYCESTVAGFTDPVSIKMAIIFGLCDARDKPMILK